eukprot:6183533-Pleurochrysis_carterae.AAC.3
MSTIPVTWVSSLHSFQIHTPLLAHAAAYARTHTTEQRPRLTAALVPARRPASDDTRSPSAS